MSGVPRHAARVILLDPDHRVLLIRFTVQRQAGSFTFWATPGGGLENGETPIDGASRELREELGLDLDLEGPVHLADSEFEHNGAIIRNFDTFFVARCLPDAPKLLAFTKEEQSVLKAIRLFSVAEIDDAIDPIFPVDLASVVNRLVSSPQRVPRV